MLKRTQAENFPLCRISDDPSPGRRDRMGSLPGHRLEFGVGGPVRNASSGYRRIAAHAQENHTLIQIL